MPTNYLRFDQSGTSDSGKTKIFAVVNFVNTVALGKVKWHGAWRKYVFEPGEETIYDPNCLREIADFCESETKSHGK